MAELRLKVTADDYATKILADLSARLEKTGTAGQVAGKKIADGSKQADAALTKTAVAAKVFETGMQSSAIAVEGFYLSLLGPLGALALLIAALYKAAMASDAQAQSMQRLRNQLEAANISYEKNKDSVQEWAGELQRITQFSDGEFIDALGRAVKRTNDLTQAQKLVQLSADIAVSSGRDFNAVVDQLTAAAGGSTRGLRSLQLEFGATLKNAKSVKEALEILGKRFGGNAAAATGLGKEVAIAKNNLSDLFKAMGEGAAGPLQSLIKKFNDLSTEIRRVGEVENTGKTAKQRIENINKEIHANNVLVEDLRKNHKTETSQFENAQANIERLFKARYYEEIKATQEAADEKKKILKDTSGFEANESREVRLEKQRTANELQQMEQAMLGERLAALNMEQASRKVAIESERDAKINALKIQVEEGRITQQQANQVGDQIQATFAIKLDALNQAYDVTAQALKATSAAVGDAFASNLGGAVSDVILKGKSLEDAYKSIFAGILETAIKTFTEIAVKQAILNAASGGATGGIFSAIGNILKFADGTQRVPGPVGAPRLAVVHGGEQVTPFGGAAPSGGGGGNTYQISMSLAVADLGPADRAKVVRALIDEVRAGTDTGREFSSQMSLLAERNAGRA